jgi:hypothetical protein
MVVVDVEVTIRRRGCSCCKVKFKVERRMTNTSYNTSLQRVTTIVLALLELFTGPSPYLNVRWHPGLTSQVSHVSPPKNSAHSKFPEAKTIP